MPRVLILSTSRKTRGGITSVVKAHEKGDQWRKYNCCWVQTHRDGSIVVKLWYFSTALILFLVLLPFIDIVHFHFSESTSAKRKRLFMPIALLCRKRIISHFHAFSIDTTICGKDRSIYEYLFRHSDAVVVLSEYWKKALVSELDLDENKVKILYNPCPQIESTFKCSHEVCSKEILFAGTVCHRKGYDDLIRAFSKIAHQHNDWTLVFAGNGEIENGKSLALELGVKDQTRFLGWVSGQQKEDAFRNAAIFCLPSYAEGFPMAVLDAWAYGLPVIATPVGGIPDVARDEENMLLFAPGDINSLSIQLEKLMASFEGDRVLYNRIKVASMDFSQRQFNINTINKQLGDLYHELSN